MKDHKSKTKQLIPSDVHFAKEMFKIASEVESKNAKDLLEKSENEISLIIDQIKIMAKQGYTQLIYNTTRLDRHYLIDRLQRDFGFVATSNSSESILINWRQ